MRTPVPGQRCIITPTVKTKFQKEDRAGEKVLAPPMGSLPLPRWVWGPLSVPCRLGTPAYMLQAKTKGKICVHMLPRATMVPGPASLLRGGGLRRCHVSKAPDLSPPPRRAPTLPRAQRLWTPLAIQDGSSAATCPSAPDPALLIRRDLVVSHVYCSGPHLPQWWAPVLTHVPWLSAGHRDKKKT
jgi:hypothetical protein